MSGKEAIGKWNIEAGDHELIWILTLRHQTTVHCFILTNFEFFLMLFTFTDIIETQLACRLGVSVVFLGV
jgi:hypothetical protein